jgi:hypothetical protein
MSERIDNYPFYWEFLLACGGGGGGGRMQERINFNLIASEPGFL